jgi:hypothetical protein
VGETTNCTESGDLQKADPCGSPTRIRNSDSYSYFFGFEIAIPRRLRIVIALCLSYHCVNFIVGSRYDT